MSKLLSTLIFSLFLLFQTISIADDTNETSIEEQTVQTEETESEEQEHQAEVQEEEEAPSEAELEAQKAEEDEIREAQATEKAEEE
jgi:flagella basal body P-ring formation protein FlgA